jgi:mycoredoxin
MLEMIHFWAGETMIKMYTTSWCGDCRVTKRVLEQRGLAFEEINIEENPEAAKYVMSVNGGRRSVPTLEFNGDAESMSNFNRVKLDAWLSKNGLISA